MHSAEMPKKVLQTKADPNLALHEAQPSKYLFSYPFTHLDLSLISAVSLGNHGDYNTSSLGSIQHKDREGKIIGMADLLGTWDFTNRDQRTLIVATQPGIAWSAR